MASAALDLTSPATHGPLVSTINHLSVYSAPSDDGNEDGMSTDDTGSTLAHESRPATPRDEVEESNGTLLESRTLSALEPISEERMNVFRQEYNVQVMQRFGDNSSSKCFTRNAAAKVIKVMMGEEVDTKWIARSKERGLMLGNEARPFSEEEVKAAKMTASQVSLWKQLIGDDGNPILDSSGTVIVRKVALVEEFFDYINNLHFGEMKYVGEKSVFKRIREICACLPRQAINIYKKHCPHCQRSSRALNSKHRLAKKNKMKENEESPFNGLSMVPMKRSFTAVDSEENCKLAKLEVEQEVINPDRQKAAGIFIRSLVEEKLIPNKMFNDQPKDEIEYITAAVKRQFPEVLPDVRVRIRSHLKSIRRSSRKNGGCSERRRSLSSMCGSPAVLDFYNRAQLSESAYRNNNSGDAIRPSTLDMMDLKHDNGSTNLKCDSNANHALESEDLSAENNPEEEKFDSPDLPTDLSVQRHYDEAESQNALSITEASVNNLQQTLAEISTNSVTDLPQNSDSSQQLSTTPNNLNCDYIRAQICQMYLTSLLLPLLVNHMQDANPPLTATEMMERWTAQIRNSARQVLSAVEVYEQCIRRYKANTHQQ